MVNLSEERVGHLEEFVEELQGYIRKDMEEDMLHRSSPEFLEEVRRRQNGQIGGHGLYVFEFEDAPVEGELSLRREGAILNLYYKPGWIQEEPVKQIAEKRGIQTVHIHGFYTFAIWDIAMFPEDGNLLTVDQLIRKYIHTLHMAANELEDTIQTNRYPLEKQTY